MEEKDICKKVLESTEKVIEKILNDGIQIGNADYLYKMVDIHKDLKNEEYWKEKTKMMTYRDNYGARMRDSRGRYMERGYSGRGYGDNSYRGEQYLSDLYENFDRYNEGKEMYGNDRETEKSFDKMLQSLEDFTYLLMQEADNPEKIEKVRKTARKISDM